MVKVEILSFSIDVTVVVFLGGVRDAIVDVTDTLCFVVLLGLIITGVVTIGISMGSVGDK